MDPGISTYLIVCPLVFLAGFVDAIAGGGGLISLPAYIAGGVPMHVALGTNKLSSTLCAVTATSRYWKNRLIDFTFILPSIVAALGGSMVGARLALMADEKYLRHLLLIVLPVVAYYVLRPKSFRDRPPEDASRRKACLIAVAISLVVGCYDGFYGPGTGTFLMLFYLAWTGMSVRSATGNSRIVNLASNFSALCLFLREGSVNLPLGLAASLFSVLGGYLGSGLAIRRGAGVVRPVVVAVLALLFVKMLADSLR